MTPAVSSALVTALRALADALEGEAGRTVTPESSTSGARYYTRKSWVQTGGEARVFDRAVESIRSFRAGRNRTVLCDEMHAWIESQAEQLSPKQRTKPPTATVIIGDVDRELGKLGESPRTDDEIALDKFLESVGLKAHTAEAIVADRRKREAKSRRDADPEIARACAEETRRADERYPQKSRHPLVTCGRCLRRGAQRTSWRKERGGRVTFATGMPASHMCPHGFSNGCYNSGGNSEDDGTFFCPWCAKERTNSDA